LGFRCGILWCLHREERQRTESGFTRIPRAWNGRAGIEPKKLTAGVTGRGIAGQPAVRTNLLPQGLKEGQ
jgi:hypothetical protein